jgi:hypothetical protein
MGAGIMGLAAGAAIAYYLYGTDAGKDKRKQLSKMARKVKDKVADAKETVIEFKDNKDEFIDLAGRMKEHLKEMKDDIEDTLG